MSITIAVQAVQFVRAYADDRLFINMASNDVTELWDYAKWRSDQVYGDIEHRTMGDGADYLVDVITAAYGAGRYDCWFSGRFRSYEEAKRALDWLVRDDWKVLRDAPKKVNSGAELTFEQSAELMEFAIGREEEV